MSAAALPCFEVGAATFCEQVPNGRNTNFKCTACQPTLGKKLSLQLRKNRTACLIKSHPDGDLKNIALRAGLASPNQLRHGSAQASLALLIWLKRWIGKDELLNIFNRRFIDEDSLIACNDRLYLLLRDLSACKISYRS